MRPGFNVTAVMSIRRSAKIKLLGGQSIVAAWMRCRLGLRWLETTCREFGMQVEPATKPNDPSTYAAQVYTSN
jgi:hypothetical protein